MVAGTVSVLIVLGGLLVVFVLSALPEIGSTVDPRSLSVRTVPIDREWADAVGIFALGLIAVAGLPLKRYHDQAMLGAGQLVAVVVLLAGTALGASISAGIWFVLPEHRECVHEGCWPADAQAAVNAVPGLAAAVALAIVGLRAATLRWVVRAAVPAVVWVGAVLLLHAAWEPWLQPFFRHPPAWAVTAPPDPPIVDGSS